MKFVDTMQGDPSFRRLAQYALSNVLQQSTESINENRQSLPVPRRGIVRKNKSDCYQDEFQV